MEEPLMARCTRDTEVVTRGGTAIRMRRSSLLACVAGVVLLVSQLLCWLGVDPVPNYFYLSAWYCYILIVDHFVYRREGTSLVMDRPGELFVMMVWSAGVWLLFEGINLRLHNWVYLEAEPSAPLRHVIGILSFATVLPAIFETVDLLETTRAFRIAAARPLPVTARVLGVIFFCGVLSLALPLLWPRYFFPLVWLGFVLMLDPINFRAGSERALLCDLSKGSLRRLFVIVCGGAVCGVLWEYFNYWADT
jgi:hypothetical protein